MELAKVAGLGQCFECSDICTKPTRVTNSSSTLIDVILVSNPQLVTSSGVMDLTISDHCLVYVTLNLKVPKPTSTYITTRSFKNYSGEKFSKDISCIPWNVIELQSSVDEKVEAFNDLFLACLNMHAPLKTVRIKRKSNPFMTDAIKQLISKRNSLYKNAKRIDSPDDWKAFTELRREVKVAIKKSEVEYYNQQVKENKDNSASIWKVIRQALPRNSSDKVQYTRNTDELAEDFNQFFVSVGEKAALESADLATTYGLNTSTFDVTSVNHEMSEEELFRFQLVTRDEIKKVIQQMPSNKAPGFDKVPVKVIKDCLPHILPTITELINQSFECSTFPSEWKKAEVVPHHKEGDHELPNNNRPISLLPALSKVSERIALNQYTTYLAKHERLSHHQSGNRKCYSTETLGLLVSDHIFRAMDDKKIIAMALIDLSKAFDSLCHRTLLNKLQNLGTSASAIAWFKSYLTGRQQTTRIGQSLSSPLTITHGVPQGSILGPVLFNLYINDLPQAIRNCNVQSYVDDTKIYLAISPKDPESDLPKINEDLHRIAEWCCAHSLLINPKKTKLMLFGVRQNLSKLPPIKIDFLGQELTPSTSCKDLGIVLDSNLSFNDHICTLASSLLSSLSRINRVKHLFSKDVLMTILNSLIFSRLFYCSTIWSGTTKQNINKLQLIQNFAARIVSGKRKFEHISPVLQELGWATVQKQLLLRNVVMIYKCLHNLAPKYLANKLSTRSDVHSYGTRQCKDLNVPFHRTTTGQRSFFHHAVTTYNGLSNITKSSKNINEFKRLAKPELEKLK